MGKLQIEEVTHFPTPDGCITKSIVCTPYHQRAPTHNGAAVSVPQSCQAGLTSLLLGCAETASDCL